MNQSSEIVEDWWRLVEQVSAKMIDAPRHDRFIVAAIILLTNELQWARDDLQRYRGE